MPIIKYYIFQKTISGCSELSIYEQSFEDITEETKDGIFAKLYQLDGEKCYTSFQYENVGKTIAKVIFYKTAKEVKEWERAQQVTLRELTEETFIELVESSSLYVFEKQANKDSRNKEIDTASLETKLGYSIDSNDLSLNRLTAVSVSAIYMIIKKLAEKNKDFKAALDSISDTKIPYKDFNNNLQEISILDIMDIQKKVLENISNIFLKYENNNK